MQIIGGYAILIWYVLALGQIFGDEYDRGYGQIGVDAFAHWEIGALLVSFSWPKIPGFETSRSRFPFRASSCSTL